MKAYIFAVLVLVVIFNKHVSAEESFESSELAVARESGLEHGRSGRAAEGFIITRALINAVIANLQDIANSTDAAVDSLMTSIESQNREFLADFSGALSELMDYAVKTVQRVANTGQVAVVSVAECAEQQRAIADELANSTLEGLAACARAAAEGAAGLGGRASDLAQGVTLGAQGVAEQVAACHGSSAAQVGQCLLQALASARGSLRRAIAEFNAIASSAARLVTATPLNLAFCGTATLSNAAQVTAGMLREIRNCISSAISENPA